MDVIFSRNDAFRWDFGRNRNLWILGRQVNPLMFFFASGAKMNLLFNAELRHSSTSSLINSKKTEIATFLLLV